MRCLENKHDDGKLIETLLNHINFARVKQMLTDEDKSVTAYKFRKKLLLDPIANMEQLTLKLEFNALVDSNIFTQGLIAYKLRVVEIKYITSNVSH